MTFLFLPFLKDLLWLRYNAIWIIYKQDFARRSSRDLFQGNREIAVPNASSSRLLKSLNIQSTGVGISERNSRGVLLRAVKTECNGLRVTGNAGNGNISKRQVVLVVAGYIRDKLVVYKCELCKCQLLTSL